MLTGHRMYCILFPSQPHVHREKTVGGKDSVEKAPVGKAAAEKAAGALNAQAGLVCHAHASGICQWPGMCGYCLFRSMLQQRQTQSTTCCHLRDESYGKAIIRTKQAGKWCYTSIPTIE